MWALHEKKYGQVTGVDLRSNLALNKQIKPVASPCRNLETVIKGKLYLVPLFYGLLLCAKQHINLEQVF